MKNTESSLKLLFFYTDPANTESQLLPELEQTFNLKPLTEAGWQGITEEGLPITCQACATHDTLILQAQLSLTADEGMDWDSLVTSADWVTKWMTNKEREFKPWSITRLHYCSVPSGVAGKDLSAIASLISRENPSTTPESTPYGWLWLLNEGTPSESWQRDMLLVIPEDRFPKVKPVFIDPTQGGFTRIELYLQKCKHLTRQHESIRVSLSTALTALQQEMLEHLVTSSFNQIQTEPVLMETISMQLMRFLTQKAAVEILHNSMQTNLKLLGEHLDRSKLETPLYTRERDRISRQIEQIESDLQNAGVIEESVSAVQEIQRSAEASRFERASYLLGYTAALLAGISLFNSFLDIWSLVLENSPWVMPAAWIRILLSGVASIAIPLAATWLIARKKWPALIATMVSMSAVLCMVLSTILSN